MSESHFFWFDPFGKAPPDAEVSGTAGGFISWGGAPGWPFERKAQATMIQLFGRTRRPKYEPHCQFLTAVDPDVPPPATEFTHVEWKRSYVLTTPKDAS